MLLEWVVKYSATVFCALDNVLRFWVFIEHEAVLSGLCSERLFYC
mgnify:FL=1